jgi:hypothetical protein
MLLEVRAAAAAAALLGVVWLAAALARGSKEQ